VLLLPLLAAPPPEPPQDESGSVAILLLWVAAFAAVFLVIVALVRRRRPPAENVDWQTTPDPALGVPAPQPVGHVAETLPSAFGPPAPEIQDVPAAAPESDEPVLPAIPRSSTEWMEGDELEGADGPPDEPLRPIADLVADLHTGVPSVCDAAIRELTRHGEAAVPALERALADEDPDVRVDAARALAAIRGGPA
jgi:hypothetical protein